MKFNFKKKFGQNFLNNHQVVEKIVKTADIKDDSLIIEIGPGSGAMTSELLKTGSQVICYEIDNELIPILEKKFVDDKISIINDDFLKRNIQDDLKNFKYSNLYVVANLPYYITTPIITKLISENLVIEKMVLMVQKEVGERFAAHEGTRDYSSISIYLNYYFDVKKEFIVTKGNFTPQPNVDSIIISLNKKEKHYQVKNEKQFFKLVNDSFKFKRKNLRNNLRDYNLDQIEEILKIINKDLTYRAEQISIENFAFISNSLEDRNEKNS